MIEHPPEGQSQRVALLRGTTEGQGAKAMLCKSKHTPNVFILAVLPGNKRLNFDNAASAVGIKKATLASPEEATLETGCQIGAIPPFSFSSRIQLLADLTFVEERDEIAFNAGRLDRSIVLNKTDYLRIANAGIALIMDLNNVKALSLDLDDTLWGFDAAVSRAEATLRQWLLKNAPSTAGVLTGSESLGHFRQAAAISRLDLAHDPALLRRESIREILRAAGESSDLSDEAYAVFYAERQRVVLFDDVLPALEWLSSRFPLAAITNRNSNLGLIGLEHFFQITIAAKKAGVAKPDPEIFHTASRALGVALPLHHQLFCCRTIRRMRTATAGFRFPRPFLANTVGAHGQPAP